MESTQNTEHQTNLNEIPLVHEHILIQCPNCEKKYVVNCLDVENELPEFVCNKCDCEFFVDTNVQDFSKPLVGQLIELKSTNDAPNKDIEYFNENKDLFVLEKDREKKHCPKCDTEYYVGQPECFRCGYIIDKPVASEAGTLVQASAPLKRDWQKLITNFTNMDLHNDFIDRALEEKNLKYAAYRYGLLKKVNPEDDTTLAMLERIEKLGEAAAGVNRPAESKPKKRGLGWTMFFGVFAVVFIIMGMILPQFRNLVGVGVAMLFLIIAMRMIFNNRPSQ